MRDIVIYTNVKFQESPSECTMADAALTGKAAHSSARETAVALPSRINASDAAVISERGRRCSRRGDRGE